MCIFKRYIINPAGKRVLVKCGKCPACLQEKAIYRTNKIRQQFAGIADSIESEGFVPLFFTLTYKNDYVPFISKSALLDSFKSSDSSPVSESLVSVYRASHCQYVRSSSDYHSDLSVKKEITELDSFVCVYHDSISLLRPLSAASSDCVGVCYFKDVQDFIKRLRINLKRHYNYEKPFKFFICSEYGPTTCRPHFHGLIGIHYTDYELFRSAISESWPYDDGYRCKEYCQIARNVASYLASYVNCSSSVPYFLQVNKPFVPRSSYSHGFGNNLRVFSFKSIAQAIESRNLRYSVRRNEGSTVSDVLVPLPKYVISSFFPRFKGFHRLANNEIFSICENPFSLPFYASRLSLSEQEIAQIQRTILNKKLIAIQNGFSSVDFSEMYSNVWTIYSSNVYRDYYSRITNIKDYFQAYDNIIDYLYGRVRSSSLDEIGELLPPNYDFQLDFNEFAENVHKDNRLRLAFDSYSKDKKIRNFIYSKNSNV